MRKVLLLAIGLGMSFAVSSSLKNCYDNGATPEAIARKCNNLVKKYQEQGIKHPTLSKDVCDGFVNASPDQQQSVFVFLENENYLPSTCYRR
ncbi:MAG: hypothetical protein HY559_06095 [Gammaproteobacteria bacterium]|nr:hypothetical protein [Gammaproteobacteria bacterium]